MSAVNLWKWSQLQRELQDAGSNEKWRFVGIAENGVGHCFRAVKSATSSTRFNRISASFAKHIHTLLICIFAHVSMTKGFLRSMLRAT